MSSTSASSSQPTLAASQSRSAGDFFLSGVLVMLCVNVVQRVVGLVRNLGFCRYLSEEQLGAWALANSFFVIAIPIALLGLTGGFGRFVEHYRRKGQLGDYLVAMLRVAAVGVVGMLLWIWFAADSFGWLVFSAPLADQTVLWCIAAFFALILFTVLHEIVAALREVRLMSIMHFLQSVIFAVVGLPMIAYYKTWTALLPSYAMACLVGCLPALWILGRSYTTELKPSGTLSKSSMWRRILPFAGGLWALNLLGNLFEISDRYMLLHLSATTELGQAAVGQYHCGRIMPNLMFSVAMMLSGVLLPFVSADWETGSMNGIVARLRQMLNSMSVAFIGLGVAALVAAPLLFDVAFQGRYETAREILPLALAQAVWMSLYLVIQVYMLCCEKTRSLLGLQAAGLILNLGLNWLLITRYGLTGAVAATALSGLITLVALHRMVARKGCELGIGSLALCVAPATLIAGPVAAMIGLCVIVWIAGRTDWLLTGGDRKDIDAAVLPRLEKLGLRIASLWP